MVLLTLKKKVRVHTKKGFNIGSISKTVDRKNSNGTAEVMVMVHVREEFEGSWNPEFESGISRFKYK